MLQLNVRALGGIGDMENNFIDSEEGSGKVRLVLGGQEFEFSTNEALQLSANLITEASVSMGSAPIASKLHYNEEDFLFALYCAEKKFSTGYVGLSYFVSRWSSDRIPKDKKDRQRMLYDLSKKGLIEVYDAKDAKAIRLSKDQFVEFEAKHGDEFESDDSDSDEIDSDDSDN